VRGLNHCVVASVLVLLAGVASAQPGYTQPAPPPPGSQPYGQPMPGYGPPPGYGYQPQVTVTLTAEEQQLLAEGEMPLLQHAGGGALAFTVGFGVGHMVQGRWTEIGWLFTAGDIASYAAIIIGARDWVDCFDKPDCNNRRAGTLVLGGVIGVIGFHIWETLDAFIVPSHRNDRVRSLRARLGMPPQEQPLSLYVAPPHGGSGAIGGLTLRF
jgi:hypothetical protein